MGLRLLCVIAHPDDECFAFGGALALAADRGVEVSLSCLTDGSAGSYRGTATSTKELGQLRRKEFADSCHVLGIHKHEVLDYEDGRLEFANFSELAALLVERIRAFRPHVVLTFGGDGFLNTHKDHTVVSSATTAAFHWAAHPARFLNRGPLYQAQRLFYVTTSHFLPERHKPAPAPWTHTLDIRSVAERKAKAFRRHTTQAPLELQTRAFFLEHGAEEHYTLAAAIVPQPTRQATDLFEGIGE